MIELNLQRPQVVSLKIYNSSGILLREIVNREQLFKGNYQYALDRIDLTTTGLILLKIETRETVITQKLILLNQEKLH